MNKRYMRMITALLLAVTLTLGSAIGLDVFGLSDISKVYAEESEQIPERMKLAASNHALELYFDDELTDFAVKVKQTGDVWYSNPVDSNEDAKAGTYYKSLMKSQISLRYFNQNVQSAVMNNYDDSIVNGQFEAHEIENGIRVIYDFGDTGLMILPQIISEERYLLYTEQMTDTIAKKVKRNYNYLNLSDMKETDKAVYLERYPIIEEQNIYVLKESTQEYMREELAGYFVEVGYTYEDMEADHHENGFEDMNESPWFRIVISYRLDGENLVVEIDPDQIEYDTEKYYLVDIDVLPYFGSAGIDEEGYLFVPDGSGALIYLNNGKVSASSYIATVYGQNLTNNVNIRRKGEIDPSLTVKLPVFGLKQEEKAWFAVIESGDAYANIKADISGKSHSYNFVNTSFSYLTYGDISLGDVVGTNSFQMYSKPIFTETFSIRYAFLSEDEADYSGMAAYYRGYLEDKDILTRQESVQDSIPFYVDFIGAIDRWKSIMGVKYRSIQSLTTYKQACEIVEELEAAGVDHLKVRYTGWYNGGLEGAAPTSAKPLSALNKGGMSIKEFTSAMKKKGISVYHNIELQHVYKDKAADGYQSGSHAPRYYDKTIVKTGKFYNANGFLSKLNDQLISSYYVDEMAEKFLKKSNKYKLDAYSVGDLAKELYSDFSDSRYTDRQKAIIYNNQAMERLSNQQTNKVMGSNANVYAFPYLTDIIDVPFDSNNIVLVDEVIPFYAMVLHGYKDFTGPAVNMSDDLATTVLKSVESGSGLMFQWIYEDNYILKDTDYDYLYSVNYGMWKEQATSIWHEVNEVLGPLQGQLIIKHEKVADNVYQTTYEDGTKIVVNYNRQDVTIHGVTIHAQDFKVIKEG